MIVGYFTLITTCMVIKPYEKANPEHTQEKDVKKIISCVELLILLEMVRRNAYVQ